MGEADPIDVGANHHVQVPPNTRTRLDHSDRDVTRPAGVAYLVKEKAISLDAVVDLFGPVVKSRWDRWYPTIQWIRESESDIGNRNAYDLFDGLVQKVEQKRPFTRTWWEQRRGWGNLTTP